MGKKNQRPITIHSIYGCDIYKDFKEEGFELDLQGWGGNRPWFGQTIKQIRPKLIIEVGTWKGQSACNMAKALQDNNIDGKIVCVDTWLGSPEHWVDKKNQHRWGGLNHKHGYPQLYYQFLANVKRLSLQNYVIPFPNTSDNAFELLNKWGAKAELIYLDAAHEYESVMKDLEHYWRLLRPGGILCGDDYNTFPGVKKAVNEFAKKYDLEVSLESVFVIRKPNS